MQRKAKQAPLFLAIALLLMQTLLGSLPAMALDNPSPLQITLTTNGQPYAEGESAIHPVEVYVTTTSADSAGIEMSQDARQTWQPFDNTQPFIIEQKGEHELWFRLGGIEEKRTITISASFIQPLKLTANSTIIYVNAAQGNGGNGESWDTAYNNLQDALDAAKAQITAGETSVQIWLTKGTYTPTKQTDPSDARTATFQMQNNVAIYGGFSGTENELATRDWENNETILSGDIADTPNDHTNNAYHVFYHPNGLNLNDTAILDGVTITGGNANVDEWSGDKRFGGGMFNGSSNPTLTNVT
uniref:hypothetical protein n=1 Tax=Metasolibacillus meyeri TaxID=1071052 RepID=UPI001930FA72